MCSAIGKLKMRFVCIALIVFGTTCNALLGLHFNRIHSIFNQRINTAVSPFNGAATAAHASNMVVKNSNCETSPTKIDEKTNAFLSWALSQGIKAPKCEVHTFPGGLRGLRATEDIEEGEYFIQVPLRLCFMSDNYIMGELNSVHSNSNLSNNNDDNDNDKANGNNDKITPIVINAINEFEWPVRLAIQLIAESRKKDSLWKSYIETLPQSPTRRDQGWDKNDVETDMLQSTLPVHWNNVSR